MKVSVEKSNLIEILRSNRQTHVETYKKAMDKYRDKAISSFTEQIEAAKNDKPFVTTIYLDKPINHQEDYDAIIGVIEMSVDDTVELDEDEYRYYVLDNWSWKKQWASTISAYSN